MINEQTPTVTRRRFAFEALELLSSTEMGVMMETERFIEEIKKVGPEKIIIFIGSGFVRELGYPSWFQFIQDGVEFVKGYSPEGAALMQSRIKQKKLLLAANSFYLDEVNRSDLHSFFRKHFDKDVEIPIVFSRLVSCPFTAFVTTNFDRAIEQAMVKCSKMPEVYADSGRFRKFSSRGSVYADDLNNRLKYGLVLKLHGDINNPDEIIIGLEQFKKLRGDDSYNFLYKQLLSTYTIIFIGFSGNDPNLIWHCETIYDVCGTPSRISYLLHPNDDLPPEQITKANIVDVPYSPAENHKELKTALTQMIDFFSNKDVQERTPSVPQISDEAKDTLAFLCAGLSNQTHSSSYQCAIVSMVAEAARSVDGLEDNRKVIESISRTYHISLSDAGKVFGQADKASVVRSIESREDSRNRFNRLVKILKDGISKRSRAFGKPFQKSEKVLDHILINVLIGAFSKTGTGLALSLVDSEAPEASLIDKVLRKTIDELRIEGLGELDKEILKSAFGDMFARPTREEGYALTSIARAAVANSLAITFSGGLEKILDLMPREAYLDANVAIPLVTKDHPRSNHYHELVISLSRIHCETLLLDVFLDEMAHHCKLAYTELKEAGIKNQKEAKEYAEFHSPLRINAFISAYASGAKDGEKFQGYLRRLFGSSEPNEKDFKRIIEKLGIEVISTKLLDKSLSEILSIHIVQEKSRLMRMRAQILAQNEAIQVLWIHKERINQTVWFVTEDAALRRILRALPSLSFSQDPPSRGVMPAYGAHLLVASLYERPNLDGTFAQLLWNPSYLEQVDTMLSSTLKKFSTTIKELKKLDLLELRDTASKIMQKEMARTEKDAIKLRAREFIQGQPQIVTSIIRELGED